MLTVFRGVACILFLKICSSFPWYDGYKNTFIKSTQAFSDRNVVKAFRALKNS